MDHVNLVLCTAKNMGYSEITTVFSPNFRDYMDGSIQYFGIKKFNLLIKCSKRKLHINNNGTIIYSKDQELLQLKGNQFNQFEQIFSFPWKNPYWKMFQHQTKKRRLQSRKQSSLTEYYPPKRPWKQIWTQHHAPSKP